MKHLRNSVKGIFLLQHSGNPNSKTNPLTTDFNEEIKEGSICIDTLNKDLYMLNGSVWNMFLVTSGTNGEFIPLSGTDIDSPVTGDIELSDGVSIKLGENKIIWNNESIDINYTDNNTTIPSVMRLDGNVLFKHGNSNFTIDDSSDDNLIHKLISDTELYNSTYNTFLGDIEGIYSTSSDSNTVISGIKNLTLKDSTHNILSSVEDMVVNKGSYNIIFGKINNSIINPNISDDISTGNTILGSMIDSDISSSNYMNLSGLIEAISIQDSFSINISGSNINTSIENSDASSINGLNSSNIFNNFSYSTLNGQNVSNEYTDIENVDINGLISSSIFENITSSKLDINSNTGIFKNISKSFISGENNSLYNTNITNSEIKCSVNYSGFINSIDNTRITGNNISNIHLEDINSSDILLNNDSYLNVTSGLFLNIKGEFIYDSTYIKNTDYTEVFGVMRYLDIENSRHVNINGVYTGVYGDTIKVISDFTELNGYFNQVDVRQDSHGFNTLRGDFTNFFVSGDFNTIFSRRFPEDYYTDDPLKIIGDSNFIFSDNMKGVTTTKDYIGVNGSNNIIMGDIELNDILHSENSIFLGNNTLKYYNQSFLERVKSVNNIHISAKECLTVFNEGNSGNLFLNVGSISVPESNTVYLPDNFYMAREVTYDADAKIMGKFKLDDDFGIISPQDIEEWTMPKDTGTVLLHTTATSSGVSNPITSNKVPFFIGQVYMQEPDTFYLATGTDAGDWKLVGGAGGSTVLVKDVTYTQLHNAATSGALEPGYYYRFEFETKHKIVNTPDVIHTGDTETLIAVAVSETEINHMVYSADYPNDIIYYDLYDNKTEDYDELVVGSGEDRKGNITYRKDTELNLETHYDFRNVVFRRWSPDFSALPDLNTDYQLDLIYNMGDIVYNTDGVNHLIFVCTREHTAPSGYITILDNNNLAAGDDSSQDVITVGNYQYKASATGQQINATLSTPGEFAIGSTKEETTKNLYSLINYNYSYYNPYLKQDDNIIYIKGRGVGLPLSFSYTNNYNTSAVDITQYNSFNDVPDNNYFWAPMFKFNEETKYFLMKETNNIFFNTTIDANINDYEDYKTFDDYCINISLGDMIYGIGYDNDSVGDIQKYNNIVFKSEIGSTVSVYKNNIKIGNKTKNCNFFGTVMYDCEIGSECHDMHITNYFYNLFSYIGGSPIYTKLRITSKKYTVRNVKFGNNCSNIYINQELRNSHIGNYCENIYLDSLDGLKIGNNTIDVFINGYNNNIEIGNDCENISMPVSTYDVIFYEKTHNNITVGNNCYDIMLPLYGYNIKIDNRCYNINLGLVYGVAYVGYQYFNINIGFNNNNIFFYNERVTDIKLGTYNTFIKIFDQILNYNLYPKDFILGNNNTHINFYSKNTEVTIGDNTRYIYMYNTENTIFESGCEYITLQEGDFKKLYFGSGFTNKTFEKTAIGSRFIAYDDSTYTFSDPLSDIYSNGVCDTVSPSGYLFLRKIDDSGNTTTRKIN